ncbi:MAG: cytoskeleton protein RodZ [Cryomorphaceae bacterium]
MEEENMEDKINQEEDFQPELKTGSGSLLATARKSQNRTVEEIAAELNLSVTQIKTIELDQSEGLPEPTYVRGYIRSYAKLLGMDPEQVLENYLNPNWQKNSSLEDLPKGYRNAEHHESREFLSGSKIIVLLVLATSVGFLWYTGMLSDLIGSDSSNGNQNTPIVLGSEGADSPSPASEILSTGVGVDDSGVQNELVLNFAQTSWVDIRDVDDNRLAYKSYAQGEQLIVSSAGLMSVFIGNAEGVSAQYNGSEFDISAYREGVYAKFNLGDE